NVGIGTTNPTTKLYVNGVITGDSFYDAQNAAFYLNPASTGTSLSIDGNIVGNGTFSLSTGSDAIAVLIGTTGAGKLDAGTIDPPYTIDGEKFTTYMPSMTGVKEETTGVVQTQEAVANLGYRYTINFKNQPKGSDLWLFAQTTDLKKHFTDLVVLLSPAGNTKTWYALDSKDYLLHIFTTQPSLVSYRLTAPRFDAEKWKNTRDEGSTGFIINSTDLAVNLAGSIIGDLTSAVTEIITNLQVKSLEITDSLTLQGQSLKAYITSVVNEILADRTTTILSPIAQVDQLTVGTENTVRTEPTLIVHGDASVSGTLTANKIESSTIDIMRQKIEDIVTKLNQPSAIPPDSSTIDVNTLNTLYELLNAKNEATASAQSLDIASVQADFGFFKDYLAVLGKAVITDLTVTNNLSVASINSPTGSLSLLAGLMVLDQSGNVLINGNLTVNGEILAQKVTAPQGHFEELLSQKLTAEEIKVGQLIIAADATASAEIATDSASITTNATAGKAILPAGSTTLTINSPHIDATSLIYVTPIGDSQNQVLYVKSKQTCQQSEGSDPSCFPWFKVAINQPLLYNLEFNWWIIKLEPEKTI
ncbi:hypothetical protein KKE48_03310, partial [Patescibacteria group bacterium]|nr:hypothetical protein [Patescibacteria group bacterium]